ncbi:cell wall-active antibiotics response protein LiaF [Robertmurraya massiliosenegalensis]|uniref:cell wall-active antibiotics response protein LiaF n=1 Tax=Robertmurraya TaxID=2837507 RepID=UPI0039A6AD81
MQFKMKDDYVNKAIPLGIILLLLEVSFFNSGVIFSLLVAMSLIYVGRKRKGSTIGKVFFWCGIFFFAMSILSMMTFKFLLLAIVIHFIIEYYQSRKEPKTIQPIIQKETPEEIVIEKKPLFDNSILGERKTPDHVFEWNDINIQSGIGDTNIDLSYTVLPKGETVIFIRNFIGNVQVLIPYDIEVSIHHSSIAGKASVFQYEGPKRFNQSVQYETVGYQKAEQKVKIFTSFLVGDLEVKRV